MKLFSFFNNRMIVKIRRRQHRKAYRMIHGHDFRLSDFLV